MNEVATQIITAFSMGVLWGMFPIISTILAIIALGVFFAAMVMLPSGEASAVLSQSLSFWRFVVSWLFVWAGMAVGEHINYSWKKLRLKRKT